MAKFACKALGLMLVMLSGKMDGHANCAYGCPQSKRCPVADPNLECVVGTTLPNYPGRPRCCEVDDNHYFIDTVRAILAYGNKPELFSKMQEQQGSAKCSARCSTA